MDNQYIQRKDSSRRATARGTTYALFALAMLLASGCSEHQDGMGPGDGSNGEVVTIELSNFSFSQTDLTIAPGTTVRWVNTTTTFHTVTPDGHTEWTEWQTTTSGETFEVTFDQTGTFPYYCLPHRSLGMTGVIEVQ